MKSDFRRLHLVCASTGDRYLLTAEGENWQREFGSLGTAYEGAIACITEETELTLHSEDGTVVCETIILPPGCGFLASLKENRIADKFF